jgi:hypothetical protein
MSTTTNKTMSLEVMSMISDLVKVYINQEDIVAAVLNDDQRAMDSFVYTVKYQYMKIMNAPYIKDTCRISSEECEEFVTQYFSSFGTSNKPSLEDKNTKLADLIFENTECSLEQAEYIAARLAKLKVSAKLYDIFVDNVTAGKIDLYHCDFVKVDISYDKESFFISGAHTVGCYKSGDKKHEFFLYHFNDEYESGMVYTNAY